MKQIKLHKLLLTSKSFVPLFIVFLLAFCLRSIFIFNNSISFHYDMARDAFVAREIWYDHDLKILGPPSSTEGFYHGVLYYYLIAPFYMIGNGNPQIPALFLSLVNSITVIPLFLLSLKFFKDRRWALLSCLFFAVSYEATQYGGWLSNPGSALPFIGFFFLGLELWRENKPYGLILAVLSAAISTQFQFFFLYLFTLIPIWSWLFSIKVNRKVLLISFGCVLAGLGTFILSILKFRTLIPLLNTMLSVVGSKQAVSQTFFTDLINNYINHLARLFTNNFFPINIFIGGILGILTIYLCRKDKTIVFMIFSSLPIFLFGGHSSNYANLGIIIPAIVGVTKMIKDSLLSNRIRTVFVMLILLANLYSINKILPMGQVSLVIPQDMLLSRQLQLIDKTYQLALGQPFSINTLTLPSWTNTTWSYLYSWYGFNKYGYIPEFYGRDQIGMPGENSLKRTTQPRQIAFFIMEPVDGIPLYVYNSEIEAENGKTLLVNEYKYDAITLQQRIPK